MNAKEAFYAMALGDVIKAEHPGFTRYTFDPTVDYGAFSADLDSKCKSVYIWHVDDPAYNVYHRHRTTSAMESPFGSGTVQRKFYQHPITAHKSGYQRCSDEEARIIRNVWNWEYEDTKHRCRLPEVL